MKTLIIEDEPTVRLLFEKQIRSLGHEVFSCTTGKEALQACEQTTFGLYVLDLGLPDIDGIELCRQIRALPNGKQAMILIITGRDDPRDLEGTIEAGANDYMIKPVSAKLLHIRLKILEQQFHTLQRGLQAERALKESLVSVERAKREWESTADSLSQVICLLDSQGRVVRANRAIEHWQAGRVTEAHGKGAHAIFHPHCSDANCAFKTFLLNSWKLVLQGKMAEYEYADKRLGRYVHIQVHPISKHPQRKERLDSFAVLVVTDISERVQIQNALSKQDRLLLGIAGAMNYLLTGSDFHTAVLQALKALGFAADVDRVSLFESHTHPTTREPLMSQRYEWDRFSDDVAIKNSSFQNIPYSIGLSRWYEQLTANQTIRGVLRELPEEEQDVLAPQNILSVLVLPIIIHERLWGFLEFDTCHAERRWRDEEEAILFAMAGSIGGAIAHEQMETQLRQTSTELRAVFQALPDEYFRLGVDGSILDYKVNQNGDAYLASETLMSKWASGMLPSKVEQQFESALSQVRQTKKLVSIEYRVPRADRKKRYEEIRILPFLDDQLIVVARDITDRKLAEEELRKHRDHLEELVEERTVKLTVANAQLQQEIERRKQIEEQLRELNQQLEDASRHKSNFLANMSHELRTPLNAMIGYTSLTLNALRESLSDKQLQHLTRAEQSARVLLQLINDVLDFSKIEAGQMEIFVEEFDLTEVLEDVAVIAEGLLLNKAVQFRSEIASNLPFVNSDYTKVKQILNNLIGNAIKFTQEGYVAVRAVPENHTCIHIEVEDSGAGIPEDKIEHIFESFKQAEGSINKRFGGTGLGLSISKKFCDMLGIQIGVQSKIGQGTTFWLRIPLHARPQDVKPSEQSLQTVAEEHSGAEYHSILLIDDDEMNLNLMEEIFTTTGYTVYTGQTGQEGIQLAQENMPDVILMDLVMNEMDGFEATRQLKQDARTNHIPVIACSAVATKEFQSKAQQAGCSGYITKPIEPARLIEQVKKNVHKG